MRPPKSLVLVGDAAEQLRGLATESVHCVVTSPPYWGLRNYGVDGQLGAERSPGEYISNLVGVFREVMRVLRRDGTLWVVIGDSYATLAGAGRSMGGKNFEPRHKVLASGSYVQRQPNRLRQAGLKAKDLVGIPWKLAFALQEDGWWLRSDAIWHKTNAQPESVSDRPSRAHEYVFLLAKSEQYFYDQDAVREQTKEVREGGGGSQNSLRAQAEIRPRGNLNSTERWYHPLGRNKRSVWSVATRPLGEEHFAAFPEALVEPCVLAGTSERGCCSACGAPVRRACVRQRCLDGEPARLEAVRGTDKLRPTSGNKGIGHRRISTVSVSVAWEPGCGCGAPAVPCVVLDPFCGSGTTGVVAIRGGRDFVGVDLNPRYAAMAERRIAAVDPLLRDRASP